MLTSHGFEVERLVELRNPGHDARAVQPLHRRVGGALAGRGDVEGAEGGVSAPPAPPILLASTSPQRRAILHQLGLPFDVVAPRYEEHDPPDADPVELVRRHAQGKARSVADEAGDRPVLGVDTTVVCGGRVYGKAESEEAAAEMLDALGGATHEVVSGLCLSHARLGGARDRDDARDVPPARRP